MRRNTFTGLLAAWAKCRDCRFETNARNALGLAAQHADRHPSHEVHVEQTVGVTYNRKPPGKPAKRLTGV